MGNKERTLCSALPQGVGTESHRGDAGMRGGQAKSSVLTGVGGGSFHLHGGEQ